MKQGWSEGTGTSERESSQNRGWKGDLIPPCTLSEHHRNSKKFSRRLSGVMELNSESECAESWEHANHLNLRVGHERSVIDFNCTRTFEHDIRMRTAEFFFGPPCTLRKNFRVTSRRCFAHAVPPVVCQLDREIESDCNRSTSFELG